VTKVEPSATQDVLLSWEWSSALLHTTWLTRRPGGVFRPHRQGALLYPFRAREINQQPDFCTLASGLCAKVYLIVSTR
jgi:hypothetical protein